MLIPFNQLFKKYQVQSVECLHIGANTGQEAEEYHRQGIKKVIWVEADPVLFPKLQKHVGPYGGNCLNACVSDTDGEKVTFNIANNGGQSSSMLKFGTHSKEHPTVKFTKTIEMTTKRVDTLLKEEGINIGNGFRCDAFLNIDLQGAELLALKGMGEMLSAFDYVYIEVNKAELYEGCPLVGEIDDYLGRWGFVGVEDHWTGAGWGDKFYTTAQAMPHKLRR